MDRLSPYEKLFKRTTQGIKPGLDVIAGLLQALDNPHRRLAAVHVAGTNGKGSVCAMLASVLRASGFKTGLYTSPHLVDFAERFLINGMPISTEKLDGYILALEEVADRVAEESAQRPATFFEISTAIAFKYFADEAVDMAVIETGMGGRWDATNVLIPLVSIITHIDMDHTDFLGDTIEKIAAEKAGIIKSGRPVVSAPQLEAVRGVLEKQGEPIIWSSDAVSVMKAGEVGISACTSGQRLKIETPSRSLPPIGLPLPGPFQRENCAVAVAAVELLADMLDFEPAWKQGLESVEWKARFQLLDTDPLMLLDGAHNQSGARALVQTISECYPKHQVGFVLGFLDDKDGVGFMREIRPLASMTWTIPVSAPRGTTAELSAARARSAGLDAVPMDIPGAWNAARTWASAEPNRLVCMAGTLRLTELFRTLIASTAAGSVS